MSVTEELCTFLSKPAGTKFSRTDVTNEINAYIRANNLQNPEDKRQIIPDARLRTLLRLTPDQTLTYFNLQKAFNHLFVKKEDATTSSA
jgi:chromatin remodeling complex protein RSC6